MARLIKNARFDENLGSIAFTKLRAVDFEFRYKIELQRYLEDGLGDAIGGVISTDNGVLYVVRELSQVRHPRVCIQVPFSNLNTATLNAILIDLELELADCYWTIADGNEEIPYTVFREDDNGNRFTVGTFDSKIEAELRIEELENGHHKQHYWHSPSYKKVS